ncbi:MAG: UDP-N-acetylglucosamine 1-carboxyvinyltransferase [Clostridiales bacterium]|nr:UDP-N-acetylglucosamine 1-carboxyvinyltransferase [Clostridiales bacterium]
MECFEIKGQKKLKGVVSISGAKNAAVAIIPAAIVAEGVSVIENLPDIEDVACLMKTLNALGAKCTLSDESTLIIDSRKVKSYIANDESVRKIRASYYLMGALLGRFGHAEVALPGGCNFGERPIDQHLKGFRMMGARIDTSDDRVIKLDVNGRLHGANIYLDVASVGATINIMIAACRAKGRTVIENAAKEPHIVDTANFLNMLGANIKGAGTDVIRIQGADRLHGGEYTIIPDQIEAGTYMICGAVTGGDITVKNLIPKHMDSLTAKLEEIGCRIIEGDDYIRVISDGRLYPTNVKTMVYPGFPTDLQPQITALLSIAEGRSKVIENVWETRYQYIAELKKFGAKIEVKGREAVIDGVKELSGADVSATDLRAGAAMIIAALAAKGVSTIYNIRFIDRGYANIESKLCMLGADIKRVAVEEKPDNSEKAQ